MRPFDGWFLIGETKYRTPSVFDLHNRGYFTSEPAVTHRYGARMLVNQQLELAVEYRFLEKKNGVSDGRTYTHKTNQGIIKLGSDVDLDMTLLCKMVEDAEARLEVTKIYGLWCDQYLPKADDNTFNVAAFKTKLFTSLEDSKKQIRRELKRRNGSYVAAKVPALVGFFFRWQDGTLSNEAFDTYCSQGGEEPVNGFIQKVAEFYTICDTKEPRGLERNDGNVWENEDEIWECWISFAGSEEEAKRVCRSLEMVLKA